MFKPKVNYTKLKTNLRLVVNRLNLLQKKKSELAQKARREIADYIIGGKYERAKIRVEHVIREDYMVEGLELVEVYCDLLLSRFGMLQQNSVLDSSLMEAVSSLLWVSSRLDADLSELKIVTEQLTLKYGKNYSEECRNGTVSTVSGKLRHKLDTSPPPKILVEKYLIEIAKNYNVPYDPDPQVMIEYERSRGIDSMLFDDVAGKSVVDGPVISRPTGFVGFPMDPPLQPCQQSADNDSGCEPRSQEASGNIGGSTLFDKNAAADLFPTVPANSPPFTGTNLSSSTTLSDQTTITNEINFDDLTKRFDELKNKK